MSTFTGRTFDFKDLITFELANNHQGDVSHGVKIIREMGAIAREFGVRAALKLQLRDLDTFIHPAYRSRTDLKHIPRFLSTRLSKDEVKSLVAEIRAAGLISMAAPFDEPSVDFLDELGIEVIKVGSCSNHDWPLLEKIAVAGKPIICSVGGRTVRETDRIVSFFEHRGAHFALLHCVSIYPTPPEKLHLTYIETLRNRYPHLTVGFSTHESPDNTSIIGLVYAKGARMFEKHVGIQTDRITLNRYSADPNQVRAWLSAYKAAVAACGIERERFIDAAESADLHSLMRGVFAKRDIKVGERLGREDVFFAMPLLSLEKLRSGRFREEFVANRDYKEGEAIDRVVEPKRPTKKDIIYSTIHEVKGMLSEARIPLSHDFQVELSHHRGLEQFPSVGCVIIECINREYAKKLIVQLPGQTHPTHYHKLKDETFQVLSGTIEVNVEERKKLLCAGDTLWIPRGVWHGFRTDGGVIFEEISTTSFDVNGDSYYVEKDIAQLPREVRKTRLLNWGRHQFD